MTFAFKPDVAVSSGKSRLDDASCQLHGIVVCVASEITRRLLYQVVHFAIRPRDAPIASDPPGVRGHQIAAAPRCPLGALIGASGRGFVNRLFENKGHRNP